ncbi:MAG: hypothetical protein JSU72_19190, partial [Deltaproteobacteria bacterium]
MGVNPIELTPGDVVAQRAVFQQYFDGLSGSQQVTVFPPFPDYSLLGQHRAPKPLLKGTNEVVLSRRPNYNREFGWLLLPLIRGGKILGVLLLEDFDEGQVSPERFQFLERSVRLCLDRLYWEKRGCRDTETRLWRREVLTDELSRAIDGAERGSSLTPRRLLSDGPCPAQFTVVCLVVSPSPAPWSGAGPFWTQLGGQVADSLPTGSMAAHLGGGYVAIYWPRANTGDVQLWTESLLPALEEGAERAQADESNWSLAAGIADFPEDFYDDGPFLPWDKGGFGDKLTATEEVIRRATLAAAMARTHTDAKILTYHSLRTQGLLPKLESAIEKRLTPFCTNDERGALLMVKLNDWNLWQQQEGSKVAASRANQVLKVSRGGCPRDAVLEWAGPDRFAIFLAGADVHSAHECGISIRKLV